MKMRHGFFVYVNHQLGEWREVGQFLEYDKAREFAITCLKTSEMVRIVDEQNYIVFFEWLRSRNA
jgi:hypothetical protein